MPRRRSKRDVKEAGALPQRNAAAQDGALARIPWLRLAMLVLIVVLVYIPAIRAGYIWDDDAYVTENQTLRSFAGLFSIWFHRGATPQYYPLVFTTFWLEHHLWGLNPAGYHLINVLLHAGSALLLFFVLRRLSVPAALLAAAVFALHPVHVESVAWITERKNVLSGLFYLSSLLVYLRFARVGDPDDTLVSPWKSYVLALVLYVCALLSKSVTCSLPAAVLLILWWKRSRVTLSDLLPLVPMFILGFIGAMNTVWMETGHVGAEGEMWDLSAIDRILIAGRALWFYAAKLVLPIGLSFNYEKWTIDAGAWWQYLFPASVVLLLGGLWWFRHRIGRGPLVAALLFGGTLVPALGFFNLYPMRFSYVADHFQYLASIALTTLLVVSVSVGWNRNRKSPSRSLRAHDGPDRWAGISVVAATGILVLLGALTTRQAGVYRDQETLWNDTLAKNSKSWMAHNNLGLYLVSAGRLDEAFHHFADAVKLRPDYVLALDNLGSLLMGRGQFGDAEKYFLKAIEAQPDYAKPYDSEGQCLARQGRIEEAVAMFEKAVERKPDYAQKHIHLGLALASAGRLQEALASHRRALECDPSSAEAYFNMGNVLNSLERWNEAIDAYKNAVRIKPDYADAHFNMGNVYFRLRRKREAIQAYETVLRINSQYAPARKALATVRQWP